VASPPASANAVKELRSACAASGFHEHDGCSCSDEELIRRAAAPPPVASPPASVEVCPECKTPLQHAPGIGDFCPNRKCDVVDGPFDGNPPVKWKMPPSEIETLRAKNAALLADRAAMAERVAGLERDLAGMRQIYEAGSNAAKRLVGALKTRAEASEAEVARLREALEAALAAMNDEDDSASYIITKAALTRPDEPTKETPDG